VSDAAIELLYEEALRICRERGHDFVAGIDFAGLEVLVCERCSTVFREDV